MNSTKSNRIANMYKLYSDASNEMHHHVPALAPNVEKTINNPILHANTRNQTMNLYSIHKDPHIESRHSHNKRFMSM